MQTTATLLGLIPLAADPSVEGAPFTHERTLVGASMLVAVVTAFAFLELAARGREKHGQRRLLWMASSGAMLGLGIWATHFMGMLALESPLKHGYELGPTAISAVVGVASGLSFLVVGERMLWRNTILAGAIIGVGAVVMHYLGMQGLRIEAELTYRPLPVLATSLGALIGSVAGFQVALRADSSWLRAALAFPMGAVTAGLHYTDVAATIITPRPVFAPPWQSPDNEIAMFIGLAVAIFVAVALFAVLRDNRAPSEAEEQSDSSPEQGSVVVIPRASARASSGDAVVVIPDRDAR